MSKYTDHVPAVIAAHPGLNEALCALSFFEKRWKPKRMSRGGRSAVAALARNDYLESVRMARVFVRAARAKGWRGSAIRTIREAAHAR